MRLKDNVAIVTGGGHGIGAAYCEGLAAEGAAVAVADIDEAGAGRVADGIRSRGGRALAVRADVSNEASTLAMASQVLEAFGRIDVLINNAAIFATVPMSRVPIDQIPPDEWDRLMAVNLRGLFLVCRAVLPAMRRQKRGKIINISSSTVLNGSPTRIHYVTSKAGVIGFTRCLAREVGPDGICVNAISPGSTLSEADPTPQVIAMRQRAVGGRALARVQVPADLVGTAVFLASAASDFITGQTLCVDGGEAMV